jgi:hypothetical protein
VVEKGEMTLNEIMSNKKKLQIFGLTPKCENFKSWSYIFVTK